MAKTFKVKATRRGYFGCLREEGDVFALSDDSQFGSWMVPLAAADKARLADRMKALGANVRAPAPKGALPTTGPGFIGSLREPVGFSIPEDAAQEPKPTP